MFVDAAHHVTRPRREAVTGAASVETRTGPTLRHGFAWFHDVSCIYIYNSIPSQWITAGNLFTFLQLVSPLNKNLHSKETRKLRESQLRKCYSMSFLSLINQEIQPMHLTPCAGSSFDPRPGALHVARAVLLAGSTVGVELPGA